MQYSNKCFIPPGKLIKITPKEHVLNSAKVCTRYIQPNEQVFCYKITNMPCFLKYLNNKNTSLRGKNLLSEKNKIIKSAIINSNNIGVTLGFVYFYDRLEEIMGNKSLNVYYAFIMHRSVYIVKSDWVEEIHAIA